MLTGPPGTPSAIETSCENRPRICAGQTGASLKQDNPLFIPASVYSRIPQTPPKHRKPPRTTLTENRNAGAAEKPLSATQEGKHLKFLMARVQ